MDASAHFSNSYVEARARFLGAARSAGLALDSHTHPLVGRDGELLALDLARMGDARGERLLIVSSGCHGVEGYAGSGVQHALLSDPAFQAQVRASGATVLMLHAVNPWGFSWCERWTHENVDLNRNFIDFSDRAALPQNPGYDELAEALVPEQWPSPEADAQLWAYFHRHGERATQSAISGGQYRHAQGLYFGGHEPTWSRRSVRWVLRAHAAQAQRLVWIDLHTATGPLGGCEVMLAAARDASTADRTRAQWGDALTQLDDGSASLSPLSGVMALAAHAECAQAELTAVIVEFGTVPHEQSLQAIRANQWLSRHPEADQATRSAIKARMRDAFFVDTEAWKASTVEQGRHAVLCGLAGLSS